MAFKTYAKQARPSVMRRTIPALISMRATYRRVGRPNSVCVSTLEPKNDLLDDGGRLVFGRDLKCIPKFTDSEHLEEQELPKILVKLIKNIDSEIDTIGLYRVNGVAVDIQSIRNNVDQNNYKLLDKCTNVSNLTSVLKLFLRELPTPLITRKILNDFKNSEICPSARCDPRSFVSQLKKLLESIDDYSYRVLRYILLHSKRVADDKGNLMDSNNMAIVIGPNIVESNEGSDYGEILAETELGQRLVELLIINVNEVFEIPVNTRSDCENLPLLI